MSKRNVGKVMAIGLAVVAAVAMPLSASAHGWGHGGGWGHRGDWDHDGWRHGGYYHHGGYWSGGRWIAGAIVTGAVAGIVSDALAPRPVYYAPAPVVYGPPAVVYENGPPVVTQRVVTRTVVYDNGYPTSYVRDDGYDGN